MSDLLLPELPVAYTTVAGEHRFDAVVENSEFLAFARRADAPPEALAYLAEVRGRYPDATHHCWAYRIGAAYRFSDDGEPGGTAGAPILRATEGQGVDHVVVVVVRFYGGVKLGTGGLVRAYGGAAAECLRTAPKLEVRPRYTLRVQVPFDALSHLYHLMAQHDGVRGAETYAATGVALEVALLPEQVAGFVAALQDSTRGQASVEAVTGERSAE